jgi:hypothetical protein
MFIIWRGYGFLVPIITLVVTAVVHLIVTAIFAPVQPWGICMGLLTSAVALWFAGMKFNSPSKNRVMIDKATGQEFLLTQSHSLFFIKMQYWSFIVGTIGIIVLISLATHR